MSNEQSFTSIRLRIDQQSPDLMADISQLSPRHRPNRLICLIYLGLYIATRDTYADSDKTPENSQDGNAIYVRIRLREEHMEFANAFAPIHPKQRSSLGLSLACRGLQILAAGHEKQLTRNKEKDNLQVREDADVRNIPPDSNKRVRGAAKPPKKPRRAKKQKSSTPNDFDFFVNQLGL